MRLIRAHLSNFRQHRDSIIHFPPAGVIGIVGTNEAGKSTILEGIAWALYGAPALRGVKGGIRWTRAPARHLASVRVEFEVRGTRYEVFRSENDAEVVSVDGVIASGTAPVTAYVPGLVGMNYPEFAATYMCGQKDLARIASMGGVERQQFYRNVMGVGRVDSALKACRKRTNELRNTVAGLRVGLGNRAPLAAELDAALAAIGQEQGGAVAARAAVQNQQRLVETVERELAAVNAVKETYDGLGLRITRTFERSQATKQQRGNLVQDEARALQAGKQLEEYLPELGQLPALRAELAQLQSAAAVYRELKSLGSTISARETQLRAKTERIEAARRQIATYDADAHEEAQAAYTDCVNALSRLREKRDRRSGECVAELRAAQKEMETTQRKLDAIRSAGVKGSCPTCLRALGDAFSIVEAALLAALNTVEPRYRSLCAEYDSLSSPSPEELQLQGQHHELAQPLNQLSQLKADIEVASRQCAEWLRDGVALIAEIKDLKARQDSLERPAVSEADLSETIHVTQLEVRRIEALDEQLRGVRALADSLPTIRSRITSLDGELQEINAEHGQLVDQQNALGFDTAGYQKVVRDLENARAELGRSQIERARREEALAAAEHRRDRAIEVLDDHDQRAGDANALEESLRLHERVATRMDEFRAYLAGGIRPELEELVSGFVSLMTDGRHESVRLTDDFDLIMVKDGVEEDVVSGGTEDVAALAMRLSSSKMIADRAGHPLSLMVLDEPVGSLDAVRRENVLTQLHRLRSTFQQVLLITHVEGAKQSVDFCISVDYDEITGSSSVTCPPVVMPEGVEVGV